MVSRHRQRVGDLGGFCLHWLLNPGNLKLNYTRIATPVHAPGRCTFILTWAHAVIIIIITIPARVLGNQSCSQTGAMSFQGKKNNPRVAVRNVSDLNPRHRRVIAGCSNGDIVMLRRRRRMMVLLCIQGRASAAGNNLLSPKHCWESRWTFKSCTNACNVTNVDENAASVLMCFICHGGCTGDLFPVSRYRSVLRLYEYKIRILALYVQYIRCTIYVHCAKCQNSTHVASVEVFSPA